MQILPARPVAAAAAVLLLLGGIAACGSDDDEPGAAPAASAEPGVGTPLVPMGSGNPFVDAERAAAHMPMTAIALSTGIATAKELKGRIDGPAAELRSGLTWLLTEHAYLAGIAVATAYEVGERSPAFQLALDTLDTNSIKVSDAIGQIAPDERDGFLDRWRGHVSDVVDYALGAKTPGRPGAKLQAESRANLAAYAKSSGAFFDRISGGELAAKDVEASFNDHLSLLVTAVDSLAAGEARAYSQLREAAAHMPMMARALSTGIATFTEMDSDPGDAASTLRADLTHLLTEHVYAAAVAVFVAYTADDGADSEQFTAAAAMVDSNSRDLAAAIASLAGKEKGDAFYASWSAHVTDFVDYALGAAAGDEDKMAGALANLDAYRTTAGAFFSDLTGGAIPADAVAADLRTHIVSTAAAIDSLKTALLS
ncbi:MAG: hypothetical protein ACT4PP_04880 [Sporichthyaceae bacterium]